MEEEGEARKEKENQQQPHIPLLVSLSYLCLFPYLNWTRKTLSLLPQHGAPAFSWASWALVLSHHGPVQFPCGSIALSQPLTPGLGKHFLTRSEQF